MFEYLYKVIKKEIYQYGKQIMLAEERRKIFNSQKSKKSGLDIKFISENTVLPIDEIEKL